MDQSLIKFYFHLLSNEQIEKLIALEPFYREWNAKINLISRKDMDEFVLHHVLHSLSLSKFMSFTPGTEILDLGTGGGFPGIPLAIVYPEVQFHMIDGTGKKIKVVQEAIQHFHLPNASAEHIRVEEISKSYDYVTARAVMELGDLLRMTRKLYKKKHVNARPNGLIAYKGFPLREESQPISKISHEIFMISKYFKEEYFEGKCIVYVPQY